MPTIEQLYMIIGEQEVMLRIKDSQIAALEEEVSRLTTTARLMDATAPVEPQLVGVNGEHDGATSGGH